MGRVSAELGRRIYLDTNIVIYVVEGFAQYAAQIQALLDAMDAGEGIVCPSFITRSTWPSERAAACIAP